jgi:response regulator of citrate/malate metabolism
MTIIIFNFLSYNHTTTTTTTLCRHHRHSKNTMRRYVGEKVRQEEIREEWRCSDIDVIVYVKT